MVYLCLYLHIQKECVSVKSLTTLDKSPATIAAMFNSVASHYDFMNNLMTMFSHIWTRYLALRLVNFQSGQAALDLATGTGDFVLLLHARATDSRVIGVDISEKMLAVAQHRAKQADASVEFRKEDINHLSFADSTFHVCTIGYGIRNVEDPIVVMREVLRVTKPGGRFAIVEATPPVNRYLRFFSQFYFQRLVPLVAKILSPNGAAYSYFAESVNNFPTAPRFAALMRQAGWTEVCYYPQYFGTVTVFLGKKSKLH